MTNLKSDLQVIITEEEARTCQYALQVLIKEYPHCADEFYVLNQKLINLGYVAK